MANIIPRQALSNTPKKQGQNISDQAHALIAYIKDNKFVCPMPQQWNTLWQMLPDRKRIGTGWEPALPLILSAWHETDNHQKSARLLEHIIWADQKNVLDQIDTYLRRLTDKDWLTCADNA